MSCIYDNYNSYLLETLVDSGGSLLAGAYQFTTKKITAYGTETQWELARQPIYVNDDADSLGHNNVDGAEGGTITNKSIQLNVTHNGSTEFSKIKIGILVTINGISIVSLILESTSFEVGAFTTTPIAPLNSASNAKVTTLFP